MNTGIFAGKLGRDAEVRATPSGQEVANFSLAVNVGFGDKKETLWVDCALWGERARKLAPYLTKGKSVSVGGDVGLRTYDDKNGKTRASMTCNVQRVTLQGDAGGGQQRTETAQTASTDSGAPAQREEFDDDIPF